jgi:hypothetical protein
VKVVHGDFDGKDVLVTLFILDILPYEPLELVEEEIFELVDICTSKVNIIEEVELKVLFESLISFGGNQHVNANGRPH